MPLPIDGTYDKILVVTDLATAEASSLPTNADATTTRQGLEALFRFTAPRSSKSDNVSAHCARSEGPPSSPRRPLARLPAGTPRYNGSVEAGIGS